MKLTLKIAVGVFLGGMAVLLVSKVPGWLAERRAEQQEEFAALLYYAKAENIISRCGKPESDAINSHGTRKISYKGPFGLVTLEFINNNADVLTGKSGLTPNWLLESASDASGLVFGDKPGSPEWGRDLARALPCLRNEYNDR